MTGSQTPSEALTNLKEHFVQSPLTYSAQLGEYIWVWVNPDWLKVIWPKAEFEISVIMGFGSGIEEETVEKVWFWTTDEIVPVVGMEVMTGVEDDEELYEYEL